MSSGRAAGGKCGHAWGGGGRKRRGKWRRRLLRREGGGRGVARLLFAKETESREEHAKAAAAPPGGSWALSSLLPPPFRGCAVSPSPRRLAGAPAHPPCSEKAGRAVPRPGSVEPAGVGFNAKSSSPEQSRVEPEQATVHSLQAPFPPPPPPPPFRGSWQRDGNARGCAQQCQKRTQRLLALFKRMPE